MTMLPDEPGGAYGSVRRPPFDETLGSVSVQGYPGSMTEHSEARHEDSDADFDEFAAAQDGDYEPDVDEAEGLADEDERPVDDLDDDGFPDEDRIVVFDDEPDADDA
ncbi:hypothetical protein HII28_15610 [Planctomonas sp. JC2975]|uniref:hypothetical protein n=1 Tax=Planctomonas sp. JC2975 TaxID=2729626 RepID=UPI00147447B2|nr:hypothetical protein [Planctomonas sp. JC2975]NNC13297.1 hypothetical protein [Planctomonas sp. JC2975]